MTTFESSMAGTSAETSSSLQNACEAMARKAKAASRELLALDTATKNQWLEESAEQLLEQTEGLIAANQIDLEFGRSSGMSPAEMDRLALTPERIQSIARGLLEIAKLPDPVGEVIESKQRPNGLTIDKVLGPLGVVFFIYEARPNVTADAAAICVKSGNAVILRCGKEARSSSQAILAVMQRAGEVCGIPEHAVQLVDTADRNAIDHFLKMSSWIDLAIPRGGKGLIERVVAGASMPVLKHYDGNCHVYVDKDADLSMAVKILENSKCQRMGVCNACESLLVHRAIAKQFLPMAWERLKEYDIEVRGDGDVCKLLPNAVPANETDWSQEYLGPILSAKIVDSLEDAIAHINHYGSHHTDAIVTQDQESVRLFLLQVDSSAVVANASTRFNDGGEIGLGAEIGISTDKFHARGPCGLRELTCYKYLIRGAGQIRG